jgi:DNA primase
MPAHGYWLDRGISLETLKVFEGGVVENGTMANRYVFPVFNSKKQLIGVTGRYVKPLKNKNTPKWLHKGRTSEWKYPLQVNYEIIKEKEEIVLVESIGDMLALWEAGTKNVLIVFGLNLSSSIASLLIKLDPSKIFISFNNDSYNKGAGNKASQKTKQKLTKHFNPEDVIVKLPDKNDFGEMNTEEIKLWTERNFAKR